MSPRVASGTSDFATQVAEAIDLLMKRSGVSGAELGRRIGKSQNYVAKRLRRELPFSLSDLGAIADALDVPAAEALKIARGMAEVATLPREADTYTLPAAAMRRRNPTPPTDD